MRLPAPSLPWASPPPMSMPTASGPVAPWLSSAAASTPTPFAWWAAGVLTPCFDTCMLKPFPSSGISAAHAPPWRLHPTTGHRPPAARCRARRGSLSHPTAKPTHPPTDGRNGPGEQGGGGGRLPVKLVLATLTPSLLLPTPSGPLDD